VTFDTSEHVNPIVPSLRHVYFAKNIDNLLSQIAIKLVHVYVIIIIHVLLIFVLYLIPTV